MLYINAIFLFALQFRTVETALSAFTAFTLGAINQFCYLPLLLFTGTPLLNATAFAMSVLLFRTIAQSASQPFAPFYPCRHFYNKAHYSLDADDGIDLRKPRKPLKISMAPLEVFACDLLFRSLISFVSILFLKKVMHFYYSPKVACPLRPLCPPF